MRVRFGILWSLAISSRMISFAGEAQPPAKRLEAFCSPPREFKEDFGAYKSPLVFEDGRRVKSAAEVVAVSVAVVANTAAHAIATNRKDISRARFWVKPASLFSFSLVASLSCRGCPNSSFVHQTPYVGGYPLPGLLGQALINQLH